MTNAAIAAGLLASNVNTPQQIEQLGTRILTHKGTTLVPTGGCGVGATDLGDWGLNFLADLLCLAGASTPQNWEEVQTIVCCRGHRTDSLAY